VERTFETSVDDWLQLLAAAGGDLGMLLAQPEDEQNRRGHLHTLREITQQPYTWVETARHLAPRAGELRSALEHVVGNGRAGFLALTGSGSSLYAGECLAPGLQRSLGIAVQGVACSRIPRDGCPATLPASSSRSRAPATARRAKPCSTASGPFPRAATSS